MSSRLKSAVGKAKGKATSSKIIKAASERVPGHGLPTRSDMKGLDHFVSDIRHCNTIEQEEGRIREELAKIRKLFVESKKIDGYTMKKSICKLLYMHMLGYDVDVGYRESLDLVKSYKFSEKQIAYITIGALLHEDHPVVPLSIQALRSDLNAVGDTADYVHCLALTTIASIGGKQMAEGLSKEVAGLLLSKSSSEMVQKKAALCLLQLYRSNKEILSADVWAEKFTTLLSTVKDMGVLCSIMSLLLAAVKDDKEGYQKCRKVVLVIFAKIVLQGDYPRDYVYQDVPHPWMQIKLMQFLQQYPPPTSRSHYSRLMDILNKILASASKATDGTRSESKRNALNIVVFEAMRLVIHLDCNAKLLNKTARILATAISSSEANTKYLGLDTMAYLATIVGPQSRGVIRRHHETVIKALHHQDVSIRRRALKLMYEMCDKETSRVIVREMLHYLTVAEVDIREELVVKIAILAEKYASDNEWYVTTVLRLLILAAEETSSDIWFNVIRVVSANPSVQAFAAKAVFDALADNTCGEAVVKVSAYILGEYGDLICKEKKYSAKKQFELLLSYNHSVSTGTKAILLSTFAKFLNLYPDQLKKSVSRIFRGTQNNMDAELQQRACEYTNLFRLDDAELVKCVLDRMPALSEVQQEDVSAEEEAAVEEYTPRYNEQEHVKHTEDQILPDIGSLSATPATESASVPTPFDTPVVEQHGDRPASSVPSTLITPAVPYNPYDSPRSEGVSTPVLSPHNTPNGGGAEAISPSPSPAISPSPSPAISPSPSLLPDPGVSTEIREGGVSALPVSPGRSTASHIEEMFKRLCVTGSGVLYQDKNLQLGVKSEFQRGMGRLLLFYGNKTSSPITSFSTIITPKSYMSLQMQELDSTIGAGEQVRQLLKVTCLREFQDAPSIQLSYLANGKSENVSLRLPIVLAKFVEPTVMSKDDFMTSWKRMGGPPFEHKSIFKPKTTISVPDVSRILGAFGLAMLGGIDPNPNNLVGSGTLYTGAANVPCLLRCESNLAENVIRLTIRTVSAQTTAALSNLIAAHLMG